MTTELTLLTYTLILALVQILLTACVRTKETGLPYNAGPRDVPSSVSPGVLAGRLLRAQHNLFETLPIFIAAVLIINLAQLSNTHTHWGCLLYFWGRLIYIPLYASGIKYLRSLAWLASLVGLIMLITAAL